MPIGMKAIFTTHLPRQVSRAIANPPINPQAAATNTGFWRALVLAWVSAPGPLDWLGPFGDGERPAFVIS